MTEPAKHSLEIAIERAWQRPNWRDSHVAVAVSGGPDSIGMLRAIWALKQRDGGPSQVFVAHFHHGLRGPAADDDQRWIEDLCTRWQIPLELGRAAAATELGDGWEAAARTARYEFLLEAAEKRGARFVAVAHTADDQVETVLHHILRGTGLAGLAGIPRERSLSASVSLVRPLLDVRRRDVRRYLEALGQDFRTDATNANNQFTRNWLRNELLPAMRACTNAEVDESILRLAIQAREAQQFIADTAEELADKVSTMDSKEGSATITIRSQLLTDRPPLLIREVSKVAWRRAGWPLQSMGFHEWQQLAAYLQSDGSVSALQFPGNVRAIRRGELVILERPRGHAGARR